MPLSRRHLASNTITYEALAQNTIVIEIPVHLLAKSVTVAIDSTGVKEHSGHFTLTSNTIKHLKEAYLEAHADTPTATDAAVAVELYNSTDGAVAASVTFSGAGGKAETTDISSTLKTLTGKTLSARINVTTASATAGATQTIRSAVLRLVIGIS